MRRILQTPHISVTFGSGKNLKCPLQRLAIVSTQQVLAFSRCHGGLGICKFLFQDLPTFRAGEEFARLSGPECSCQEVLPRPRLQKQAAEPRMPTLGCEWSETHGHYDLDVSVPHSLLWFPGQHGKPIAHRHPICVLSVLL